MGRQRTFFKMVFLSAGKPYIPTNSIQKGLIFQDEVHRGQHTVLMWNLLPTVRDRSPVATYTSGVVSELA